MQVVHRGELYWLNSSNPERPAFWQGCRAVIARDDLFRICWLGLDRDDPHERIFDLKKCTRAISVRRGVPDKYNSVELVQLPGRPLPRRSSSQGGSKLHAFELSWPGRSHRFACADLADRVKWLGAIFAVLSKYSHAGSVSSRSSSDEFVSIFTPISSASLSDVASLSQVGPKTIPTSSWPPRSGTDTPKAVRRKPAPRSWEDEQRRASIRRAWHLQGSPEPPSPPPKDRQEREREIEEQILKEFHEKMRLFDDQMARAVQITHANEETMKLLKLETAELEKLKQAKAFAMQDAMTATPAPAPLSRPSTPSLVASLGSDLQRDAWEYQRGLAKDRDSALPPLPLSSASKRMHPSPAKQHGDVSKGPLNGVGASGQSVAQETPSSKPAKLVAVSLRAEDAPSRASPPPGPAGPEVHAVLDPALPSSASSMSSLGRSDVSLNPAPMLPRKPAPPRRVRQSLRNDPPPHRTAGPLSPSISSPSTLSQLSEVPTSESSLGTIHRATAAPLPWRLDAIAQARANGRKVSAVAEPDAWKEETAKLLREMHNMLVDLQAGQKRNDQASEHQQKTSVYLRDLHEFLAKDRASRREEFGTSESCEFWEVAGRIRGAGPLSQRD